MNWEPKQVMFKVAKMGHCLREIDGDMELMSMQAYGEIH